MCAIFGGIKSICDGPFSTVHEGPFSRALCGCSHGNPSRTSRSKASDGIVDAARRTLRCIKNERNADKAHAGVPTENHISFMR